ncbi:hypothetical protein BY996DRAFT_4079200 [Phakopsora pachyrhizi]|nr:hypothetical protein BY996DRAFT_4079200 [Phakopsora pachyrhizi]
MTTNPPANRSTLFRFSLRPDSDREIREKLNILIQRQENIFEWQRQNKQPVRGKLSKGAKSMEIRYIDRIPTINPNQIKSIKSSSERCKVYSKGLSELENCMTGLDLWVWIKTAGKNDEGCVKDRNEDQESSLLTPIFATNNNYIHCLQTFNESVRARALPHQCSRIKSLRREV